MAKVKYTDNANVKLTMSEDQYIAVMAILNKVRLGRDSYTKGILTDLLIDVDSFNAENTIDTAAFELCDEIKVTFEFDGTTSDFTIET